MVHVSVEGSTDLALPCFIQFRRLTYKKLTVLPLNPVPN